MIIFGWGRQTIKQIGIVFKQMCGHCNNEEYWVLTRTITWFTLFFIPVIPYSVKYFLSCPICKYGLELNGKQVDDLKPLAELNQKLIDGKITTDEYHVQLNLINSDETAETVNIETIKDGVLPDGNKDLVYCANCGTGLTKELKFCGNCGSKVVN